MRDSWMSGNCNHSTTPRRSFRRIPWSCLRPNSDLECSCSLMFSYFLLRYTSIVAILKSYVFFVCLFFLKQLQSVNPFGMGDSPVMFDKNLKTFLSSLDKVTSFTLYFTFPPTPDPHCVDHTLPFPSLPQFRNLSLVNSPWGVWDNAPMLLCSCRLN